MNNVLKSLQNFVDETLILESHPVRSNSLDEKVQYLTALALIMNADDEMSQDEKKYIKVLMNTFNLPNDMLADIAESVVSPSKDLITDIKEMLNNHELQKTFFYDAIMISFQDGDFSKSEEDAVEQLRIIAGANVDDVRFITKVIEAITSKDLKAIAKLGGQKIWQWKYLLDYYKMTNDCKTIKICSQSELNELLNDEQLTYCEGLIKAFAKYGLLVDEDEKEHLYIQDFSLKSFNILDHDKAEKAIWHFANELKVSDILFMYFPLNIYDEGFIFTEEGFFSRCHDYPDNSSDWRTSRNSQFLFSELPKHIDSKMYIKQGDILRGCEGIYVILTNEYLCRVPFTNYDNTLLLFDEIANLRRKFCK